MDGAQVMVRTGTLTTGVLGGFQPDYRTSGSTARPRRSPDFSTLRGRRELPFVAAPPLPTASSCIAGFWIVISCTCRTLRRSRRHCSCYQSTEIDLHRKDGDVRQADFRLTNTFITMNYQPLDWLTANLGYDATRRVEFLETEKSLADSLRDRDLRQGCRGSVFFRLPLNVALSLLGGYRAPAGGLPVGYSGGSGVRLSDIGGSDISLGGQYMRVKSPYTDGNDITGDLEYAPTGVCGAFTSMESVCLHSARSE